MTGARAGGRLEFSLVNDLRGISSAAARIDAFCAAHGLSPGIRFDVTLAVDELVTNTIGYGYDDGGERSIDVVLRIEGDTLTVEIADDGRAFDPLQAPEPDLGAPLEERAARGACRRRPRHLSGAQDHGRRGLPPAGRTQRGDADEARGAGAGGVRPGRVLAA